jgi:hydroxyacylglutathione hydrolase
LSSVFKQVNRIDSGCVSYIIGSVETDQCVIVDPLLDIEMVLSETRALGLDRITHVIDTHTHADHISGARNIAKISNLTGVHMHANSGSRFKTIPVHDGDFMRLGNTELQFIHTPRPHPGSRMHTGEQFQATDRRHSVDRRCRKNRSRRKSTQQL